MIRIRSGNAPRFIVINALTSLIVAIAGLITAITGLLGILLTWRKTSREERAAAARVAVELAAARDVPTLRRRGVGERDHG